MLYVTVQTKDGRYISDIRISATLTFDDQTIPLDLGTTDETGKVRASLDLRSIPAGEDVQIHFTATRSDGQAVGSQTLGFRTWW